MNALPAATQAANAEALHAALLDHARSPRNRRELPAAGRHGAGRNALCGDTVEVALVIAQDRVHDIAFRGRGCNVCIASASLMTELLRDRPLTEARALQRDFRTWAADEDCRWNPPALLAPLSLVRARPARSRCLTLAWEALADALA